MRNSPVISLERRSKKIRVAVGLATFLALLLFPVPLLPPHRLAETIENEFGLGLGPAYLISAVAVQFAFYLSIGVLAALAANRFETLRGRCFQAVLLPLIVICATTLFRSLRAGHLPHWVNAAVPALACICGVTLGLGLLYRYLRAAATVALVILVSSLWIMVDGTSSSLRNETEARLRHLAVACPTFAETDSRFVASLQNAFAPEAVESKMHSAIDENRAAVMAWGIAIGHPRLAKFVGLSPNSELVGRVTEACRGITLDGREDWPRHYALSAGISILGNPLVSDAGGLMKEQLDTLTQGSGFSFGDLAADRAGVRFAAAATASNSAAKAMQERLQKGVSPEDLFPAEADFPENLTVEQFRARFGGVGTQRYYEMTREIERALDGCVALTPSPSYNPRD